MSLETEHEDPDVTDAAWRAVAIQLWETMEWIHTLVETESSVVYVDRLMNSQLVIRMVQHAIAGNSDSSEIQPSSVHQLDKMWIAYSLAPDSVQNVLAPLVSMYKHVAYHHDGLGPNDLWIDDDGEVLYPPPPPENTIPLPPPANSHAANYQNPPLQQSKVLPHYPPVSAAEIAQVNLDLMTPHGPELWHG